MVVFVASVYGDTMDTIKSDCERKWKTDYRMIKYCVNKQVEAANYLVDFEDEEILSSCRRKWQNDFRMAKYCADKQLEAKRSLGY